MDDVFSLKSNQKVDKFNISENRKKKKIFDIIKKHKVISLAFISFVFLSVLNFYFIFSFVKILENI